MEKPVRWMGSSLDDLREFPDEVQRQIGYALHVIGLGDTPDSAKPYKVGRGSGAGVMEIVEDFDTNTYRAVYTVKFKDVVYVLHCFEKKSKQGIKTTKRDQDLVKARFKAAEADYLRWKAGR
jgi:phage-related protein